MQTTNKTKTMFSDYYSDVTGFSSRKPESRSVSDCATETLENNSKDETMQSYSSENAFTQTDSPTETKEYDEKALAEYLTRIYPLVLEELEIEVDFTEMNKNEFEESSVLSKLNEFKSPWEVSKFKVSKVAWNCTGGTLAIGYGVVRHDTWCNHESKLVFQHPHSTKTKEARVIITNSCITSLQFHQTQPSLLIAGLYNGDVLVVDLSKEEDRTTFTCPREHTSSVVAIGWIGNPSTATCYSADADGNIFNWKINLTSRMANIIERFKISRRYQSVKVLEGDDGLEITTAAKVSENQLIVGVAEGGLLHCSLSSLQAHTTHSTSTFKDPVIESYQPHLTVITSIRAHPVDKLFASASSDGQIRVYIPLKVEPKFIINTVDCSLDIFWTGSPAIIGVCGSNNVFFVRVATGKQIQDLTLTMPGTHAVTVTEPILQRNIVAVGNTIGNVEVWRISLSSS